LANNEISERSFYSSFEAVIIASFATGQATSFVPDISKAFHSMKVICRYINHIPKYQTLGTKDAGSQSTEKPAAGLEIVFQGVSLRYPSRPDVRVLEGFNLRVEAGQHIAFCGPSGEGKTSTLSLLQR
jgi:ATP-binding cassette subfamily B (MDR/TAP) protein 1